MKVFQNNIELFPAQFKACCITSSGKVKLINNENDIKEYFINEVKIVDNNLQNTIDNLKKEVQKLKNDVKDLLQICKENGISIEDENGNTIVNGESSGYRNNQNSNHHTEEVIYEDHNNGATDFFLGIALGSAFL